MAFGPVGDVVNVTWQKPVSHGVPSQAGPVSGDDLPVWLTIPLRAVALSRAASPSGFSRSDGFAARTSAEMPATCGADIDVPWSQANALPFCSKQAKSAGVPSSRQISVLLSVAPRAPQPPKRTSVPGRASNLGTPYLRAPPGAVMSTRSP